MQDADEFLAQEAYDLYPKLSMRAIARRQGRSRHRVRADIIRLGGKIQGWSKARVNKSHKRKGVHLPKCIRCYLVLESQDEMYPDLCPICIGELQRGIHYPDDYIDNRLRDRLLQWGFL